MSERLCLATLWLGTEPYDADAIAQCQEPEGHVGQHYAEPRGQALRLWWKGQVAP